MMGEDDDGGGDGGAEDGVSRSESVVVRRCDGMGTR